VTVGQYRTTPVTLTDTQVAKLQLDSAGSLRTVAAGTGATAAQVQGASASGATAVGNPLPGAGTYTSGALSTLLTGQRSEFKADSHGNQRVAISANKLTSVLDATFGSSNTGFVMDTSNGSDDALILLVGPEVYNGTNYYATRGDANGSAVTKGLSATRWRYTSGASPILSNTTTAVTIKTAGGTGVKNAIDSIQLTTTAFTASVPLAIRDGASGTVMWALTVPTAGLLQPVTIVFEQPLVGTANTLLEVVTTTANTAGTVTLNVQGHTET
jgi:hypothetical protein